MKTVEELPEEEFERYVSKFKRAAGGGLVGYMLDMANISRRLGDERSEKTFRAIHKRLQRRPCVCGQCEPKKKGQE
jgi:hypothetical protein